MMLFVSYLEREALCVVIHIEKPDPQKRTRTQKFIISFFFVIEFRIEAKSTIKAKNNKEQEGEVYIYTYMSC